MSSFVRAHADSENAPVAVILPGAGYTAMGPLLYWCGEILSQAGWQVQGVEWTMDAGSRDDPQSFVVKKTPFRFPFPLAEEAE